MASFTDILLLALLTRNQIFNINKITIDGLQDFKVLLTNRRIKMVTVVEYLHVKQLGLHHCVNPAGTVLLLSEKLFPQAYFVMMVLFCMK